MVHTLLDSGATANVMPEEVATMLLSYVYDKVETGVLREDDRLFPIAGIERYNSCGEMVGVSA